MYVIEYTKFFYTSPEAIIYRATRRLLLRWHVYDLGPCCPNVGVRSKKAFFPFFLLIKEALSTSEKICEQIVRCQGISKYTKLRMRRQIRTNKSKIISARANQINAFIILESDESRKSRRMRSCVHLHMPWGTTFYRTKFFCDSEGRELSLHMFSSWKTQ